LHLAAAIFAFVALEWVFFQTLPVQQIAAFFLQTQLHFLGLLLGFMVVSWIADRWARSDTSLGVQYFGLGVYVLAEAIIFLPLLYIAQFYAVQVPAVGDVNVIGVAGLTTLAITAALTAYVFITKTDFSFLRSAIAVIGLGALALIGMSMIFGWNLGVWFTVGMIVFASMTILYSTSNVLHHYRPTQYVAASLSLFASVALLFWYVLLLFMRRD
jgi:FtsH-binding integral membrane protein